jgi:ATP/maltotriose-dependent transcriptional regulator MalT
MTFEAGEPFEAGRTHIIKRPRLTSLLDESKARIILLVAPAGYGKTTLAREWLSTRPHAWYQGNQAIVDVAALVAGMAKTASNIVPAATDRIGKRLSASSSSNQEIEQLADLLAEDLSNWPNDAWFAFDDYQFACDSDPAESFVEHLASACPIRLLVCSRSRPRWATARRLLYGEIFEVGQSSLAMIRGEGLEVLAGRPARETGGLLALADGWPALIGLAASAGELDLPPTGMPDELYAYFAEELYQAVGPGVQEGLRRLSLARTITPDVAHALVGAHAAAVIDEGIKLGFFLAASREQLELHPLVRSFLKSKFIEKRDVRDRQIVTRFVNTLVEEHEWDDAFELIEEFFDDGLLLRLFEAALPHMLAGARLPTLAHWIETALIHEVDSPIVDYADAEVSFRRGDPLRAEALALQATRRLPNEHELTSKTLWLAGTSAHRTCRDEVALEHFRRAEATARSESDAQTALWGRFNASASLDREADAEKLLAAFERRSGATVDDQLRVASGHLLMASLVGRLERILELVASPAQLVDRSKDPLIQSSFLNILAATLVANGRYEAGLSVAENERKVAETYGLAFVLPLARLHIATAQLGLRNPRACKTNLRESSRLGMVGRDGFLLMNVGALWARLHLSRGAFDQALSALDDSRLSASTLGMEGELLAWRSLALACVGQRKAAGDSAEAATAITRRIEVSGLVPWTHAVLSVQCGRSPLRASQAAFRIALDTGNIDAFVTAYRACPELLRLLATNEANHDQLKTILERARDHALAESVGIRLPSEPEQSGPGILTRREREVFELVAQGLSNKDIGRTLFITESTAKVHVRAVCRKLGVRSRAEAAGRAGDLSA